MEPCHGIAVIFRTKINRYSIFDAERMVLERKIILLFVSIGRGDRGGGKKEEPFKYRVASGNKEVQLRFIIAPALRFVSPAAGFNAKFIVDREKLDGEKTRDNVALSMDSIRSFPCDFLHLLNVKFPRN